MLGPQEIPFQHINDIGAFLWGGGIPKFIWKKVLKRPKAFPYKVSPSQETNVTHLPTY